MDALRQGVIDSPEQSSPSQQGETALSEPSSPSPVSSEPNHRKRRLDLTQYAYTISRHLKLQKTHTEQLVPFANVKFSLIT